jgi:peroxiredoxin
MDPIAALHQPAPNFSLPGLDGRIYKLEDQLGKLVIIDFWSAECPWTERADQILLGYLREWGEDVTLWSIASNANEPVDLVKKVAEQRGLPLLLLDQENRIADLYGAQATPYLFVVDENGYLRYQGALDDVTFRRRVPTRKYLYEAVEAIRSGRKPDPDYTPGYGCAIVRRLD